MLLSHSSRPKIELRPSFNSRPVHSLTEPTCSGVTVTRKAGKHLMLLRLFDHGLEASEVCSGFESDLLGKITREVERI